MEEGGLTYPRIELLDRYRGDLEPLQTTFGGTLSFDAAHNGRYSWRLEGWGELEGVVAWRSTHRPQPFRSRSAQRFFLLPECRRLLEAGAAYSAADPLLAKAWRHFRLRWEQALSGDGGGGGVPFTPLPPPAPPSPTLHPPLSEAFWQWLGGLVDGDGHLYLDKGQRPAFALVAAEADLGLLEYIQASLGFGSIGRESSAKAHTLRVYGEADMIPLLKGLNGQLRGVVRCQQLGTLGSRWGLGLQAPEPPAPESHWFAGVFAADGHLAIAFDQRGYPVPSLRVTSKYAADLEHFRSAFGGNVHPAGDPQRGYRWYVWVLSERSAVGHLREYFRTHPTGSIAKERRLGLLEEFYDLRDRRAYRPGSPLEAQWTALLKR